MNTTNFNILVIDDDPLVLEDSILMYQEMIHLGDLKGIFGEESQGTVSGAKNTREAEAILKDNFTRDPHLIEVLHVDERMPDERGSEFVDRMRRIYTLENIGALLVTGYATDVSVLNSREKGVYRYIPKPVTPTTIKPHLHDVVEMIFLKDKPRKKDIQGVFIFKQIKEIDQLREYYHIRFLVWSKLNYIPAEFRSTTSQLEIDDYDKFSIPLGGYRIGDTEELAVVARIITHRPQRQTIELTQKILDEVTDPVLNKTFNKEVKHPFTVLRDCDGNGSVSSFLNRFGGIQNTVEFSRIMDKDDSYRGMYLSTRMAQFHDMYAKYILNSTIGIATCLVKHVGHNCNRNAFTDVVPDTEIFDARRVEQIARALYIDLNKIDNRSPEFHDESIRGMYGMYLKNGAVCYCKRVDCIRDGYKLQNSDLCEKYRIGG